MELGSCYSNVIKIQVIATYQAPSITLPEDIYVCGSSIGTAWTTWRPMALINGMAGNFFTIVYLPNDAEFNGELILNNGWVMPILKLLMIKPVRMFLTMVVM